MNKEFKCMVQSVGGYALIVGKPVFQLLFGLGQMDTTNKHLGRSHAVKLVTLQLQCTQQLYNTTSSQWLCYLDNWMSSYNIHPVFHEARFILLPSGHHCFTGESIDPNLIIK